MSKLRTTSRVLRKVAKVETISTKVEIVSAKSERESPIFSTFCSEQTTQRHEKSDTAKAQNKINHDKERKKRTNEQTNKQTNKQATNK